MILQEAMCLIQVKIYTCQKNKNTRSFSGAYPIDVPKAAMYYKEFNYLIKNNIYVVTVYIYTVHHNVRKYNIQIH